jgi:hypothetical protein
MMTTQQPEVRSRWWVAVAGVAYMLGLWVVAEVGTTVVQTLGFPPSVLRLPLLVGVSGLPFVLLHVFLKTGPSQIPVTETIDEPEDPLITEVQMLAAERDFYRDLAEGRKPASNVR